MTNEQLQDEITRLKNERYRLRSALGYIVGLFHDSEHEAKAVAQRALADAAVEPTPPRQRASTECVTCGKPLSPFWSFGECAECQSRAPVRAPLVCSNCDGTGWFSEEEKEACDECADGEQRYFETHGHYPGCGVYEGTQRGPCSCSTENRPAEPDWRNELGKATTMGDDDK